MNNKSRKPTRVAVGRPQLAEELPAVQNPQAYALLHRGPGMIFFRTVERLMQEEGSTEIEIDFNEKLFKITLVE
jgi:hypothetical protein